MTYAAYCYGPTSNTPVWSFPNTIAGQAVAIAYSDGFVYTTGHTIAPGADIITMKIVEATGAGSATWPATSDGAGLRRLSTYADQFAHAIWIGGTNVYVTGRADQAQPSEVPQRFDYVTTRYSAGGTTPSRFPELYPANGISHDDAAYGVTDYCAGQLLVTGEKWMATAADYDMGSVLYAQETLEISTTHTIVIGGLVSGSNSDLGSSNNSYLRISPSYAGARGDPNISLRLEANLGSTPPAELCLEIESRGEDANVTQKIAFYNNVSNQYEVVDSRMITTSDRLLHISPPGDPAKYINGSGVVKAEVRLYDSGAFTRTWHTFFDLALWRVNY